MVSSSVSDRGPRSFFVCPQLKPDVFCVHGLTTVSSTPSLSSFNSCVYFRDNVCLSFVCLLELCAPVPRALVASDRIAHSYTNIAPTVEYNVVSCGVQEPERIPPAQVCPVFDLVLARLTLAAAMVPCSGARYFNPSLAASSHFAFSRGRSSQLCRRTRSLCTSRFRQSRRYS